MRFLRFLTRKPREVYVLCSIEEKDCYYGIEDEKGTPHLLTFHSHSQSMTFLINKKLVDYYDPVELDGKEASLLLITPAEQ